MHFSLFDQWGAKNSLPVWAATRIGLDRLGASHASHDWNADVAIIWSTVWAGRMQPNHRVWHEFRNSDRPVVVLEVGMLRRGLTWKVGVNGTGMGCYNDQMLDPNRAKNLKLELDPWHQGDAVVIACQRHDSEQWHGQPNLSQWLQDTVQLVRAQTSRPIIVRPHPRQRCLIPAGCDADRPMKKPGTYDDYDLDRLLANAWCVINWNSGVSPIAAMRGVPVYVGPSSLAAPVGNLEWNNIERPLRPERDHWLHTLAHTEWLLDEIATGQPIARLLPAL